MARVFLLLGTNQGDLHDNLERAIQKLQDSAVVVKKRSRISRTKAWGKTNQPDFLNVVLEVETVHEPLELLFRAKAIESDIGRCPGIERWGPRIIDIDILFYDDCVIETETLTVPHREFLRRPFAIELMAEIAPTLRHPGTGRQVHEYLES